MNQKKIMLRLMKNTLNIKIKVMEIQQSKINLKMLDKVLGDV